MSQRLAYVKWKHVAQREAKYTVKVVSSRKREEKEAVTLEMETETNEFVAGALEEGLEYIVTVRANSSEGTIIASGAHSIPLMRKEYVPIPQGVTVTAERKSLRVEWDVSSTYFHSHIIFNEVFVSHLCRWFNHKLVWKGIL